ncbi:L,D-transpeptidase [Streptomyces sp. NBC_00690]|uniref:L,D-transpeptidase n=1 Tax=Streptomyces sp. NBC_00690 TaxID=2975808 RepID=UPI002E2DEFEC|nr:Ig-like domain-containing protein [Streptomyces sp. NBC_00690]
MFSKQQRFAPSRSTSEPGRTTAGRDRRLPAIASAGLAVLLVGACSGNGSPDDSRGGKSVGEAPARPEISVNLQGQGAAPGKPVLVKLARGELKDVKVTTGKGAVLGGAVSNDGRTWTSRRAAAPGTAYTVRATTADGGSAQATFATAAAEKVNKLELSPGKGTTVGIAQPVSIVFDNPVKNRAAVERALKVTTSNKTVGSWGWMEHYDGRTRIDWRPKEYWPTGTKVRLQAELNGIDSGATGGWFVRDYDMEFTIGTAQVVKVDLGTKKLTLLRDGKVVRSIPVSAGTPGGKKRSWGGTSVLMAKEGTINMNSETVGLGDAYNKMVDYSMRLTWSGMYAHAAPWNSAHFGNANRSSGCIGMSTSNASWLYSQVRAGDPFEISGPGHKGDPAPGNGFGEWNLSWQEWQTKSALS